MFLGEFRHTLEETGRVRLPSKLRDLLATGLVITKGQDRCLYVFPLDRWAEESAKVQKLPRTDRRVRNYARAFFAGATQLKPDKQGRILVPATLRDYAGLKQDVAIVGVSDRVEIWPFDRWTQVSSEADDDYSATEHALSEDGI